jgi:hypothetical protein
MKYFKTYALFESMKQAEDIARGLNIDPKDIYSLSFIAAKLSGMYSKYLPMFIKIASKDKSIQMWFDKVFNLLVKYRLNIQSSGIDITKFDTYEQLLDFFEKIESDSAVKKLINMVPKQVRNLMTGQEDKFYNLFLLLHKMVTDNKDLSENYLKDVLFSKISRNKTVGELYNHIKGFIEGVDGEFNVETIISKVKDTPGAELIHSDDTIVIALISNFEASKELGKDTSWCIAQDDELFTQYVKQVNKQFFIWDTSKQREDILSMIGVTMIPNGYISACHARNDSEVDVSYVEKWRKYFISTADLSNMKTYRLSGVKYTFLTMEEFEESGFSKEDVEEALEDDYKKRELYPRLIEAFYEFPSVLKKVEKSDLVVNLELNVSDFETRYESGTVDQEYILDITYDLDFLAQDLEIAAHFVDTFISKLSEEPQFSITCLDNDDESLTEEDFHEYVELGFG